MYLHKFGKFENLKASICPNEPTHKRFCCMPQINLKKTSSLYILMKNGEYILYFITAEFV